MSKVLARISLIVMFSVLPLKAHMDTYDSLIYMTCKFNSQKAVRSTDECQFGAKINYCGKLVCLKGRGEVCGEDYYDVIRHGECSSGLMCCGKCVGCDNESCDQSLCRPKKHEFIKRRDPLSKYFEINLSKYFSERPKILWDQIHYKTKHL